jgi:predicted metal-dependent hydrolase
VLYHEILHLESGLASLASGHDRDFRVRERMYPNWRIAEDWLKKVATGKIAGT